MPFNFLEKEINNRLIAAIIGSVDNNINMKEISRIYGDSVGFNTLEWYLRKIRHKAVEMKAEADGRPPPAASPAKKVASRRKKGDTSPTKDTVKTGRVTKKKAPATKVKKEPLVDNDDVLDSTENDGNMDETEEYV